MIGVMIDMKTRNGLVSNSSSSSFVISIKDPDAFKVLTYSLPELGAAYNGIVRTEEEMKAYYTTTFEDVEVLRKARDTNFGYTYHREEWLEIYETCLEELAKGKVICFGHCSDGSDNVVERGLVGGGWDDLPGIDPKQELVVIKDCDGY